MQSLSLFSCISSVTVFLFLAVPGYISTRKKLISASQIDGISILLVTFLWPALVIDAMTSVKITPDLLRMVLYTGSVSLLIYLISIFVAFLFSKVLHLENPLRGLYLFAIAFNNTGLIGMPFIKDVLGNEALFIASIIELINDLFIFSIGVFLIRPRTSQKQKLDLSSLISPGFLSVFLGFFLFAFKIPIPEQLANPIHYMANATTSIAMFLIGAQLGEVPLKELFREKKAYQISFFRLVLIPSLVFIVFFLILGRQTLADTVLVIMFGMPVATSTAIFARRYKNDYVLATKSVMMSTLCSAITLPFFLYLTTHF